VRGWSEIWLLLGNVLFTVGGVWMLVATDEKRGAVAIIAFAGMGTLLWAWLLATKVRSRANARRIGLVEACGQRIPASRTRS